MNHQTIMNEIQNEFQYCDKPSEAKRNKLLIEILANKNEIARITFIAFERATYGLPLRGLRRGERIKSVTL